MSAYDKLKKYFKDVPITEEKIPAQVGLGSDVDWDKIKYDHMLQHDPMHEINARMIQQQMAIEHKQRLAKEWEAAQVEAKGRREKMVREIMGDAGFEATNIAEHKAVTFWGVLNSALADGQLESVKEALGPVVAEQLRVLAENMVVHHVKMSMAPQSKPVDDAYMPGAHITAGYQGHSHSYFGISPMYGVYEGDDK